MFEESNTLGEYRWECPYRECKYSILSYTQSSFEQRKAEHLDKHLKKLREEREEREKKLTELLEPLRSARIRISFMLAGTTWRS